MKPTLLLTLLLVGCNYAPKKSAPTFPSQEQVPAETLQPWTSSTFLQGDNPYAPRLGEPLSIKTF